MTPDHLELLDFALTEIVFLMIAVTLGVKALVLRRLTRLGQALAVNNAAFTLAYIGAFLSAWAPFFRVEPWSWGIRLVILVTAFGVLWEMHRALGGWRVLFSRALRGFIVWRTDHDPEREGY